MLPLRSRGDLDLGAARRLRRHLDAGVDILHLHTGRDHALGRLAGLGRRDPAVVVARRVDFPVKGGLAGAWKYGGGVDRFVAVSARVAEVLVGSGVPRERVSVVHSGIDAARFEVPADPGGLRREVQVDSEVKLLGYVGALVSHKAPLDLVDALAVLPETVHAVFAGEGDLRTALLRRAGERGVAARVHLLGHRTDVPRILRSVDVFVLPSHLEGLGTSVLDAMAAGAPVVAARGGGIPEMVEDGESGLLVSPGQPEALGKAIARVLDEPELAARLRRGAAERVRAFSAERMVDETLAVYEDVLERRARARSASPRGS